MLFQDIELFLETNKVIFFLSLSRGAVQFVRLCALDVLYRLLSHVATMPSTPRTLYTSFSTSFIFISHSTCLSICSQQWWNARLSDLLRGYFLVTLDIHTQWRWLHLTIRATWLRPWWFLLLILPLVNFSSAVCPLNQTSSVKQHNEKPLLWMPLLTWQVDSPCLTTGLEVSNEASYSNLLLPRSFWQRTKHFPEQQITTKSNQWKYFPNVEKDYSCQI